MAVIIQAPFDTPRSTHWFPNPELANSRASQAQVTYKRHTTGRLRGYFDPSEKFNLVFRFRITRMKDFELSEIIRVYHTVPWKLTDHEGNVWRVELTSNPLPRPATGLFDKDSARTGDEEIDVTINFSAERIS